MTSSGPGGRFGGRPGSGGGKKIKIDAEPEVFVVGGSNELAQALSSGAKRVPYGLLVEATLRSPHCESFTVSLLKHALKHHQHLGGVGPAAGLVEPLFLVVGGRIALPPSEDEALKRVFDEIRSHNPSIQVIERTPDGISKPFWRALCFANKYEEDLRDVDRVHSRQDGDLEEISQLISSAKSLDDIQNLRPKVSDPRFGNWLDDPSTGNRGGISAVKDRASTLVAQIREDLAAQRRSDSDRITMQALSQGHHTSIFDVVNAAFGRTIEICEAVLTTPGLFFDHKAFDLVVRKQLEVWQQNMATPFKRVSDVLTHITSMRAPETLKYAIDRFRDWIHLYKPGQKFKCGRDLANVAQRSMVDIGNILGTAPDEFFELFQLLRFIPDNGQPPFAHMSKYFTMPYRSINRQTVVDVVNDLGSHWQPVDGYLLQIGEDQQRKEKAPSAHGGDSAGKQQAGDFKPRSVMVVSPASGRTSAPPAPAPPPAGRGKSLKRKGKGQGGQDKSRASTPSKSDGAHQGSQRPPRQCTHCGRTNHTVENCWHKDKPPRAHVNLAVDNASPVSHHDPRHDGAVVQPAVGGPSHGVYTIHIPVASPANRNVRRATVDLVTRINDPSTYAESRHFDSIRVGSVEDMAAAARATSSELAQGGANAHVLASTWKPQPEDMQRRYNPWDRKAYRRAPTTIMVDSGASQSIARMIGIYSTQRNDDFTIAWGHGQSSSPCVSSLALTIESFPLNDPHGCRSNDMVPYSAAIECNYVPDFANNAAGVDIIVSVQSLTSAGATVTMYETWHEETKIHGHVVWPAPPGSTPRVTYLGKNHIFLAEAHDCIVPWIGCGSSPQPTIDFALRTSAQSASNSSPLEYYASHEVPEGQMVRPIPQREGLDDEGRAWLAHERPADPLALPERSKFNASILNMKPWPPRPPDHEARGSYGKRAGIHMVDAARDARAKRTPSAFTLGKRTPPVKADVEQRAWTRDPISLRAGPSGNGSARP